MTATLRATLRAPSAAAAAAAASSAIGAFFAAARLAASAIRHFRTRPACLGQTDRDRLLAARDFLTGTSAAQLAALALVHRALDLLRCLLAVLPCHGFSVRQPCRAPEQHDPCQKWDASQRASLESRRTCDHAPRTALPSDSEERES